MDFNQRNVGMDYIDSNSFSRKRGSFGGGSRNRSNERGEYGSRNNGGYQHYQSTKESGWVRDAPTPLQHLGDPILSDYIVLDAVGTVTKGQQLRNRLPFIPGPRRPRFIEDMMRCGLSGAGMKWYRRYLEEGLPPEEAKKKALAHRTMVRKPAAKKKKQAKPNAKKTQEGESSTTSAQGSHAAAAKVEQIAVLPKLYPDTILSKDQQSLVEEAIVQEMLSGWEHKLQFGGINFRKGFILVDCETSHSAEWLRMKIPQLKLEGVELTTCAQDNIPKIHRITLYLPRSQGLTADKILQLIKNQNEGLEVSQWKILNQKDDGEGQILTARIDNLSCQKIKENGYTIHYMFGNIPVNGLKKKKKKKKKKNTAEPAKAEDVKRVEHFSSLEKNSPNKINMEIIEATKEDVVERVEHFSSLERNSPKKINMEVIEATKEDVEHVEHLSSLQRNSPKRINMETIEPTKESVESVEHFSSLVERNSPKTINMEIIEATKEDVESVEQFASLYERDSPKRINMEIIEATKDADVKSVEHFSSLDERNSPKSINMEVIEAKEWESILADGDDVPTK